MAIIIKFIGGVGTVTGSMHLLATDKAKILIDAGLFQGRRDEFYAVNSRFPFNPSHLDCCIISHAHIDHCGNFPALVKKSFRAKAYLTPSTRDLCRYMLPDSGHIQEEDIKYVNKINRRRGLPMRQPLYTKTDAEKSLKYLRTLEYHRKLKIAPDMALTFFNAGHILGSSIPTIDISTKKGTTRIAYAVDLGRADLPYLRNPEIPKNVDYLIIESTYGGRIRPSIKTAEGQLSKIINKTVKRGGKIIIPSFALERTQEILYFLARLLRQKRIKDIPVYVDSPLAVNITKVFEDNWKYFNEEARELFKKELGPLSHKNITYIRSVGQSKKLHDKTGPMVIISASGSCENGRILHHLKNNIENPYNSIIIIGYMPRNTLGRKIVEKQTMVNIFGKPYQLKAEVVTVDAFSAHADKNNLIQYVKECGESLKKVFIVHGEPNQSGELKKSLRSLNISVSIPKKNETVYLAAVSGNHA
ncbi:MAG: MBL fold metallo-hydrolase [Candidatus Omnitrophota bacterium]|nr:MBL fold metallo-hydrolase [Candidatus Omnitrophota bacterium]